MRRISPADSPLLILPDLDALARKTFFVIRESPKMDPSTFLRTLSGAVSSGFASRNQIAMGLSRRTGVTITSQAVHDRFSEASTEFLTAVLSRLFGQRVCSGLSGGNPGTLRRIPVEDSSVQTMPKANAELFPAHGNRHGGTAGMKIFRDGFKGRSALFPHGEGGAAARPGEGMGAIAEDEVAVRQVEGPGILGLKTGRIVEAGWDHFLETGGTEICRNYSARKSFDELKIPLVLWK